MAHKSLVPKQRALTEVETEQSFETWREAMIFHISLSDKSTRFLSSGDLSTWTTAEGRGFTDDQDSDPHVTTDNKMNRNTKVSLLNLVLGSISGYAPIISAKFIKLQSTSLQSIWDRLRTFYGFRRTGGRILELPDIKMEMNESREALWERLYQFIEDSLLTRDGGVLHEGARMTTNEEFTPTLLNIMVSIWLNAINPALPSLVKQRFSTQLRSCTVFSLREEISDAVPILLSEVEEREGNINRASTFQRGKPGQSQYQRYNNPNQFSRRQNNSYSFNQGQSRFSQNPSGGQTGSKKWCVLCDTAGRPASGHFLSGCPFLPQEDKRYMSRTREVAVHPEEETQEFDVDEQLAESTQRQMNVFQDYSTDVAPTRKILSSPSPYSDVRKVDVFASPILSVYVGRTLTRWTLDCGAETNIMSLEECERLELEIQTTRQGAIQGDGKTPLDIVGEVHFRASRGHHKLFFSGLVVRRLDTPVLAGMPFLLKNNVQINFKLNSIILEDCCRIQFSPDKTLNSASKVKALKVNRQVCILPGEDARFELPEVLRNCESVAVEPRTTVPRDMPQWIQCQIITPDADGFISIKNASSEPVLLSKHTQVCQVRPAIEPTQLEARKIEVMPKPQSDSPSEGTKPVSSYIDVDSSTILSNAEKTTLKNIHAKHSAVFSEGIGCYNNYFGKFEHIINMSPNLPPQRRGRVPDYCRNDKERLQKVFDRLLKENVISRAEDVRQPVEHVHPSFIVKKASGGDRLVTSFGEMAEYARPQPTVNCNIEHALHQIGQYENIIITDMKEGYFQIPLSSESSKYVGVLSPYSGTFVYRRSVMGLPGSESALEELLSRVFGRLIREGKMVKVADDIFIGAPSVQELLNIWEEVLSRLNLCGLKLSPSKTRILPTSATILGWEWTKGSIQPGKHRLNALTACSPPSTVKGLRSFIGSYKYISRVLPRYAEILKPLEETCAGRESAEKITWSDEQVAVFEKAKDHLKNAKQVVLPKRTEQLHLVTDASSLGIAATLFVVRNNQLNVCGYFSAALKPHQAKLLPCEQEALAIAVGLKHFSYHIVQSTVQATVLTDSRPCVLAFNKLMKGIFSASPRVTTFLATAVNYHVKLLHISGTTNLFSDFASRNPVKCKATDCTVCQFVENTCNSSVGEIRVTDIVTGKVRLPYTTKSSWLKIQQACPDLRQVHKYVTSGATISKKKKQSKDVRRYLNHGITALEGALQGLLVIKQAAPFKQMLTRVVIPRSVSRGLLTALHWDLDHPKAHQLKLMFSREFFTLDLDELAKRINESCFTCASLKKVPTEFHKQTTSEPSSIIGHKYSADIVKRYSQCILLIREDITSFTDGTLVADEKADTLRDGILQVMSRLRTPQGPDAVIRTDPASGLRSLLNDSTLKKYNLQLELGDPKNINKNPVIESAIEEFHGIVKREQPHGGKLNSTKLAQVISKMNSTVRHNKLSAAEAWTKRNMSTGVQIEVEDKELIRMKYTQRCEGHKASATYKARGKKLSPYPAVSIGQLVLIYSDYSKLTPRDKYLVTDVEDDHIWVQKFTGRQFRARSYKVKRSDVITVIHNGEPIQDNEPSEEELHQVESYQAIKISDYDPHPRSATKSQLSPQLFEEETSDESDDDDLDSYRNSVLRLLNPNTKPLAHDLVNLEATIPDAPQPTFTTRRGEDRRAPGYLQDYITDISAFLENNDNESSDEVMSQHSSTDSSIRNVDTDHQEDTTLHRFNEDEESDVYQEEDDTSLYVPAANETTTANPIQVPEGFAVVEVREPRRSNRKKKNQKQ